MKKLEKITYNKRPFNYSKILFYDTGNSHGLSTTIWLSGCQRHCPGCFNSEAWDYASGKTIDEELFNKLLDSFKNGFVKNFVILGGEPLDEHNGVSTSILAAVVKKNYPDVNVIVYSGYTIKELKERYSAETLYEIFENVDMLIDGPYIENKRTEKRELRGSTNQNCYWISKINNKITFLNNNSYFDK